jgi:hypothetical protein
MEPPQALRAPAMSLISGSQRGWRRKELALRLDKGLRRIVRFLPKSPADRQRPESFAREAPVVSAVRPEPKSRRKLLFLGTRNKNKSI